MIDGRPAGICVALLKDTVPPSASRTGSASGDPVEEFLLQRTRERRVAEVAPVVQMAAVHLIESMPACRHHETDIEPQRS